MSEIHKDEDDNPITTWVGLNSQVPILIKTLLAHGFQKLEPAEEAKKVWSESYSWYFDGKGDYVSIDTERRKYPLITCTLGCKPIISDAFLGLDSFRIAQDSDF